jgi:purine nucleosidase
MGRRPGHLFHPAEGANGATLFGHGPVFRDLNFVLDPEAAARIVRMGVPLVLVPYDAARHVELRDADLQRMHAQGGAAAWVAERARGWLEHWRVDIGRSGFYPFDALAAAFALRPDLLDCARLPVRIGADARFMWPFDRAPALLVGPELNAQANGSALYCPQIDARLPAWLGAAL